MTWTADRPASGLVVHQPQRGFRYGAEAFWLVGLALADRPMPGRALDLGTGSGILAWLLARRGWNVLAVDRWAGWQEGWQRTTADCEVHGRVELRLGCVTDVHEQAFDLVVSNPPFFTRSQGPVPHDVSKQQARFEGEVGLATWTRAAVSRLSADGRAWLAVPTERVGEVAGAADGGWGVSQQWDVGRTRSLLRLDRSGCPLAIRAVDPKGEDVRAWYTAAREVG